MLQRISGIVLRTVKYKDTAFIADVYTDIAGRASFMVSASRSRKSAVKSVLFQPLALVELEADLRRILVQNPARRTGKPSALYLPTPLHHMA